MKVNAEWRGVSVVLGVARRCVRAKLLADHCCGPQEGTGFPQQIFHVGMRGNLYERWVASPAFLRTFLDSGFALAAGIRSFRGYDEHLGSQPRWTVSIEERPESAAHHSGQTAGRVF